MRPVLAIHGGAGGRVADDKWSARAASLDGIGTAAWELLQGGASALEVVIEAVHQLEDDPLYNAGRGSKLQADGSARLSASLCDGATERFSGVVNVRGVGNPIVLCRALLGDEDRVLAGAGAAARARELGLPEVDVRTEEAIARWERGGEGRTGTVGAVALDADGALAAATSTGGRGMERPGRVSDSATVAGNFASGAAAASATGIGEDIVDGALAVRVVAGVEAGADLASTCDALLERMRRRGWKAGWIAVDARGAIVPAHTTEVLYWWARDDDGARSFAD